MGISMQTAIDIALAHREIETAGKLLADIEDARVRRKEPEVRDVFGRRQDGIQMGIPSGEHTKLLFNVPWNLAIPIISAHIEAQRVLLVELGEKARSELDGEQPSVPE